MHQAKDNSDFKPLPFSYAKRHEVFCRQNSDNSNTVFYSNALPAHVISELSRFYHHALHFEQLKQAAFKSDLAQFYGDSTSTSATTLESIEGELDLSSLAAAIESTNDLLEQEDDAPIVRLINGLITEAINLNASDIHLETFEKSLVVRFRIDGVLQKIIQPDRAMSSLLVSRIKIMAKLDIAEKRVPQDGRISLQSGGKDIDLRISTMPTQGGERVVLRLLEKNADRLRLSSLGMPLPIRTKMQSALNRPHGIILVTGPTGSGKTTTLYAGLNELDKTLKNILTIEDPVEYQIDGIGQTQVNTRAGMTFSRGLRAILRQDPDVVMIGEIRDLETAEIAIQASLTGHLVISTLHTNTAIGAINRLIDMGVEPFLLASSLAGLQAQRLVRQLCVHCKVSHPISSSEAELLGLDQISENTSPLQTTIFKASPEGCEECRGRSYKGRTGVYEFIEINSELTSMIHKRISEADILAVARQSNASLWQSAAELVLAGHSSLEEVLRVTKSNE